MTIKIQVAKRLITIIAHPNRHGARPDPVCHLDVGLRERDAQTQSTCTRTYTRNHTKITMMHTLTHTHMRKITSLKGDTTETAPLSELSLEMNTYT